MIAGNFEDKYNSKNPISKFLVRNFLKTFQKLLLVSTSPKNIVELGAGEGELIKVVLKCLPGANVWGSDISKKVIDKAKKNLHGQKVRLGVENIEKLSYRGNSFDLVICCEVLEHVENPEKALREIRRITRGRIILSVPQEPLWRVLNIARGKYLRDFGNTPGHLNHFTPFQFSRLVERCGFKILLKKYPLPWQMVLAKPR